MNRRTLALDLDGVLARPVGWQQPLGDPLPDCAGFIRRLRANGWDPVLHTCRDTAEASAWLKLHGLDVPVSERKPIASAYLDDRAVRFTGDFNQALHDLRAQKPWWRA